MPAPEPLFGPAYELRAAYDGATHLLVWSETAPASEDCIAHVAAGSRVSANGEMLDPVPWLFVPNTWSCDPTWGIEDSPDVAPTSSGWIVVGGYYPGLWGNVIAPDGYVEPRQMLGLGLSGASAHLARGPENYLLVWSQGLTFGIHAARVLEDLTVLDPDMIKVTNTPDTQIAQAVVFDGTTFLFVWLAEDKLRGARIDARGAVLDPGGFDISASGGVHTEAALASDGAGRSLAVYVHEDPATATRHVRARLLEPGPDVPGAGGGGGRHRLESRRWRRSRRRARGTGHRGERRLRMHGSWRAARAAMGLVRGCFFAPRRSDGLGG